jgi:hypothetical protein
MARIISSPQRDILPLRSISPDWYFEHVSPNTAPTDLDLRKRGRVDRRSIGQRYHRADTRDRHQTPAHLIVPDKGQQAAMQNSDLLAQHPPDNKQHLFDELPPRGPRTSSTQLYQL